MIPLYKVIIIKPQHKDLILRALTFARDDIEIAGRCEECHAIWVSSKGRSHLFKLNFGGPHFVKSLANDSFRSIFPDRLRPLSCITKGGIDKALNPLRSTGCHDMGIEGQGVVFDQAVTPVAKTGPAFHP